MSGMGSVRDCYSRCKEESTCVTFDWDARFNGCWLHGPRTSCQTLQAKEGCTHYRLKTDCNGKKVCYTVVVDGCDDGEEDEDEGDDDVVDEKVEKGKGVYL